ncbi:hypothetical protein BvCmsHHP056_03086 [Escherichia coli]|nr:hypothetical protein BvCmsHHP056_03086 [Escherichia coli]
MMNSKAVSLMIYSMAQMGMIISKVIMVMIDYTAMMGMIIYPEDRATTSYLVVVETIN